MSSPDVEALAKEQAEFWDGEAGERWAAEHERLDQLIRPLGLAAIDRLAPAAGHSVLDVGCGFGATAMELGKRVTSRGRVLGVDLSSPMLAVARATAEAAGMTHLQFAHGDVTRYDFGDDRYDGAFSRFGVMFFPNPIESFARVRAALKPGSPMAFVCWQGIEMNEWVRLPLGVAFSIMPRPAPPDPTAPGPFSLANPARTRRILEAAGFGSIEIEGGGGAVRIGDDARDAAEWLMKMGPCARLLVDADDDTKARVTEGTTAALAERADAEGVRLESATWVVRATA